MATLGEILLTRPGSTPGPCWPRATRSEPRADVHGIAHITGGGLPGNVPRALADGLGARLDPAHWPMPSVMRLFGALGGLDDDELRATFNGGLGMVVVLPPDAVEAAVRRLRTEGIPALSSVRSSMPRPSVVLRYVEGALEGRA